MISLYGIFNTINCKLYIGYTNSMTRRWRDHTKNSKKLGKNSYTIHHAMHKYGIENFIHKEILSIDSVAEAKIKEIEWIKELKSLGYKLYNETNGGEGVVGYKVTEERKKMMSKLNSGSGNPMYGIKLFGQANGNYGKKMKKHVKEELLKHRRKLSDEQVQKIKLLFATNDYTQTELANQFNVSLTQIHRIVKGKSWAGKTKNSLVKKKQITMEDANRIRDLFASGLYIQLDLAKMFNISRTQIGRIINNIAWAQSSNSSS